MEPNNIDSIFRKSVNESKGFYDNEANAAKDQIWNRLKLKEKKTKSLYIRLLLVACILLFLSTSVITFISYKTHTNLNTLAEENTQLQNKLITINNESNSNRSLFGSNTIISDTIFIEKEVIVNKPIIQTVKITDTIYINQVVYIEKEIDFDSGLIVDNNLTLDTTSNILSENFETEILINKTEISNKKKRKKLQFIIGGSKKSKDSGSLALSSELY